MKKLRENLRRNKSNKNKSLNRQINSFNKKNRKELSLRRFQEKWNREWFKVVMPQLKKKRKKLMNKDYCNFNQMKKNKSNNKYCKKKNSKNNCFQKEINNTIMFKKSLQMEEK